MPKVTEKADVLGGRGTVVKYVSGTSAGSYFYREWNKGLKKYIRKKIEGVNTLEEAIEAAPDAAFAIREQNTEIKEFKFGTVNEPTQAYVYRVKRRNIKLEDAIKAFLYQQRKRLEAGLIAKNTYEQKKWGLSKLRLYLEYRGIKNSKQLNEDTFDDYLIFRAETTTITVSKEITVINEFSRKYLLKNKYIDPDLLIDGRGIIKNVTIKERDRMANPAINAEDWRKIVDYVRDKWRLECIPPAEYYEKPDQRTYFDEYVNRNGDNNDYDKYTNWERTWFYRNLFWHFILLGKNTGMSMEEILKLKWKNVDTKDEKRVNSKGEEEEWLVTYIYTTRAKTGASREIPCNQGRELRRWIKFVKEHCRDNNLDMEVTSDSYVFASPYHPKFYAPCYQWASYTWRKIRSKIKDQLKGHKFSDHPYTLYSLRSTFIEEHLIKGTDIFLLARIAGHSVKELMASYERMDIRKRAKEITAIEFGKKKEKSENINLLDVPMDPALISRTSDK